MIALWTRLEPTLATRPVPFLAWPKLPITTITPAAITLRTRLEFTLTALTPIGSGGSQFFFVYNESFQLPPNYATFGRVIKGQEVFSLIGGIKASGESGETPEERTYMNNVVIREATEEEKAASTAKAQENAQKAQAAAAAAPTEAAPVTPQAEPAPSNS